MTSRLDRGRSKKSSLFSIIICSLLKYSNQRRSWSRIVRARKEHVLRYGFFEVLALFQFHRIW